MKKGNLFEADVVAWLREHGFPAAERRVMGGANDKGDVAGVSWTCPQPECPYDQPVTLELKNCARMALAEWVDEAAVEAGNAGTEVYAVVHKRRGRGSPGEQYVTLPLEVFVKLLKG